MQEIIEKIEELPPVPNVVHELQQLYYSDIYNASDIEKVIKRDPNLVANVLKIANSPLYSFSREIVDIRQAIVIFGLEQIIEFALASFMEDMVVDLSLYQIDVNQFLLLSQRKSQIASRLIQNKQEKFIVSNTAFLCDIAKVILSPYAKEKGLQLDITFPISLNDVDIKEKEFFGFDTIEISKLMFDKWNFDERMIELLDNFKDYANINEKAIYIARDVVSLDGEIIQDNLDKFEEKSLIVL